MRRNDATALLLGATLGVVGIAMHVTAEAARPTAEHLFAGAMSLTPAGYAIWTIAGWSLIALGVLVCAGGMVRSRRDARHGSRARGSRRTTVLILGLGVVALVGNAGVYLAARDTQGRVFTFRSLVHDVAASSEAVLGEPSKDAQGLPALSLSARVRPRALTVIGATTNRSARLEGLVWRTWGSASATATGIERYADCDPSCASGSTRRRSGARVQASDLNFSDCDGRLTLFYARLVVRVPGSTVDRVLVLGAQCGRSVTVATDPAIPLSTAALTPP